VKNNYKQPTVFLPNLLAPSLPEGNCQCGDRLEPTEGMHSNSEHWQKGFIAMSQHRNVAMESQNFLQF